jgi:GNAT superfamily N-acetyltransferase
LTDLRVRAELAAAGRCILDGLGAWRVVRTWEMAGRRTLSPAPPPVAGGAALVARPASLQDARLLRQWRNDPQTRAGSRSSAEVPWDEHLRWLTASLARADRLLLVVEDPGGPAGPVGSIGAVGVAEAVGTVRWDLVRTLERGRVGELAEDCEWEVSITVAPESRRQSLGRSILRAGELALLEVTRSDGTDVSAYLAVVQVDNLASVRLFETSGYLPDLPPDPRGFMRFRKTARVP